MKHAALVTTLILLSQLTACSLMPGWKSKTVADLSAKLKSSDPEERRKAAAALARLGKPGVEPLINALRDEDERVRAEAARALGEIKDARALDALVACLGDEFREVRLAAIEALGKINDPRAIVSLVPALKDPVPEVCDEAARVLLQMGEPAVEHLIAALDDKDINLRVQSIGVLAKIKDPRAVPAFIAYMKSYPAWPEERLMREKAIDGLAEMGEAAVEAVIEVLVGGDPTQQATAAGILGRIKSPRAIDALVSTLSGFPGGVSTSAADVLAKIGEPAVEPLIAVLGNGNEISRVITTRLLGQIKGSRATDVLIRLAGGSEFAIKREAINALANVRDPRAVEPLLAVLKAGSYDLEVGNALAAIGEPAVAPLIALMKDKSAKGGLRASAAQVLWRMNDLRAFQALVEALSDSDSDVRFRAANALSNVKDSRAVQLLIGALSSGDQEARALSARALGEIRDRGAVGPLITALKDDSRDVRSEAVNALGKLRDTRAVDALMATLDHDPERPIRTSAAYALRDITGQDYFSRLN